jgi:hypothetical protein
VQTETNRLSANHPSYLMDVKPERRANALHFEQDPLDFPANGGKGCRNLLCTATKTEGSAIPVYLMDVKPYLMAVKPHCTAAPALLLRAN